MGLLYYVGREEERRRKRINKEKEKEDRGYRFH